MTFLDLIVRFRKDEDGAVTVDWVVLTAALVALAVGVGAFVTSGLNETAQTISQNIDTVSFEPVTID